MTTVTPSKPLCANCNIEKGIFQCRGCSQVFCMQHTTNHHQNVIQQLDEVEQTHNLVKKTLVQEMAEPASSVKILYDELINKIDNWQEESIKKIQIAAKEAKNDLFQYTIGRVRVAESNLEQLTNELQQARKKFDFIETDLREWNEKLNQLKTELTNLPTVTVYEDYSTLISNIRVNRLDGKESFERSCGNADFEDNNNVVYIKKGQDIYTEVRGKCQYVTGKHIINLHVEQLTGWILFGIISESTPLQIHSYVSPSCYGWYNGSGFVYAGGQCTGGIGSDVVQSDTIQLVIDCDNRLIRLINARSGQTLELSVDIEKCPFPWQLHLNLNEKPTRIRIQSSNK
ncbi:hypothetical protein I4U23_002335 [Adineta vaga]|nr:hypothetical protein I4U23_002335 [Adineta vaga]